MAKKTEREFERKTMAAWTKDVSGRTVVGITAVTGNVDDGGDRIMAGAFAKTIAEGSRRFRHLWQHGADGWDYGVTPPIAAIKRIAEVGRDALPADVQSQYPLATGGLEVEREYLNTDRGNEILAAYQASIQLEMSIGYETIIRKWIEDDRDRVSFGHYRDLIEIKLFDTSDVNWGMNSACIGSKNLERRIALLAERMKQLRVELPAEQSDELLAQLRELYAELAYWEEREGRKAAPAAEPQAELESRAELPQAISLTPQWKRLRELELALVA